MGLIVDRQGDISPLRMVVVAILGVLALVIFFSSYTVVGTGYRGVRTYFGEVVGNPLTEGLYFNVPGVTAIHQMDIKTQKLTDKTEAASMDVQSLTIAYAVNYSVKGSEAGNLYKTVGYDYAEKLIPQVVQGGLKNASGKWQAVEIISHREEVRKEVQAALETALATRGITIENFQLEDIQFTKEFNIAVENKVIAIQQAEQAKNQTVQVTEQAKQRVIAAQADAEAMKIKSAALSQNQNLVSYEAVQKWDGVLPTMMMGGGAVPFLNLDSIKGSK